MNSMRLTSTVHGTRKDKGWVKLLAVIWLRSPLMFYTGGYMSGGCWWWITGIAIHRQLSLASISPHVQISMPFIISFTRTRQGSRRNKTVWKTYQRLRGTTQTPPVKALLSRSLPSSPPKWHTLFLDISNKSAVNADASIRVISPPSASFQTSNGASSIPSRACQCEEYLDNRPEHSKSFTRPSLLLNLQETPLIMVLGRQNWNT